MGCWDETCVLTLQPIFAGDPCVVVVVDVARPPLLQWPDDWSKLLEIRRGHYDGYGRLEDFDPHSEAVVFFHAVAWQECVRMERSRGKKHLEKNIQSAWLLKNGWQRIQRPIPPMFDELVAVAMVAMRIRRPLRPLIEFRGAQDFEACDDRRRILEVAMELNQHRAGAKKELA